MNIDLLQRVKAAILAEPESFDMVDYIEKTDCGTTACIGGWAVVLNRGLNKPSEVDGFVGVIDGLNALELGDTQTIRLFHVENWPSEFANRYRRNKTARGRAKVAAERIDYFIETGK